jgi:hypothetical protein
VDPAVGAEPEDPLDHRGAGKVEFLAFITIRSYRGFPPSRSLSPMKIRSNVASSGIFMKTSLRGVPP